MSAILEVDINKFNNNIDNIQKYIGNKTIIPVIKGNGYGTYINKRIDVLNRFNIVAVAIIKEAIELRELGYKKDILILNPITEEDIDNVVKYNITIGVCDKNLIKKLVDKNIKIHLEIETGMNRTGIKLNDLKDILKILKDTNVIVEGVYTHLSSADIDEEYTLEQLNIFKKAVKIVKEYFDLKYIHSSSSCGLLNFDDEVSNAVRPGLIIYGYKPFNENVIDVEPICKLKAKIAFIKDVDSNESIGYGRTFITTKSMRIATIQIGYADGLRRSLSNVGEVLINNKKCKIIGNVCMDSIMVDITNVDTKVGDYAYIFDNKLIKVDDIAKLCNTINYEILTNISDRVDRVFK